MSTKTSSVALRYGNGRRLTASLLFAVGVAGSANAIPVDTAITRAKLVYVDDSAMFRTSLNEAALARAGCTYASHDPAAMTTLRHVLGASRLDDARDGFKMIEPRYALYFEQKDGSTHALLLDRQYNDSPERLGTLDGKPITVTGKIAAQLLQWAVNANLSQSNDRCSKPTPHKAL